MKTKLKTIKIKEDVHKRLLDIGKKEETFSEIIERVLDYFESKK